MKNFKIIVFIIILGVFTFSCSNEAIYKQDDSASSKEIESGEMVMLTDEQLDSLYYEFITIADDEIKAMYYEIMAYELEIENSAITRGLSSSLQKIKDKILATVKAAYKKITSLTYGCWCGPGNSCTSVKNNIDSCCKTHDKAYGGLGLSAKTGWLTIDGLKKSLGADLAFIDCLKGNLKPISGLPFRAAAIALFTTKVAAAKLAIKSGL